MDQTVLSACKATKRFFRKGRESAQYFDAVKEADLKLRAGELTVLMGRSGSGKSTLLNMLGGLLAPSEGSILLDGSDLYALGDAELSKARNTHIGIIPQGHTALRNLTVVQNVLLPYLMYRPDDGIESRGMELLETLGIKHLADSFPPELSGGEVRRLAIARALICSPKVVLADEPTGDLDDENTRIVFQTLRMLADDGTAVLLVTHEQEAAAYANTVLHMTSGVIER